MKCFYHNDMDGKCAGSIVARFTGNYNKEDYIMYDYSAPYPTELIEDGETVYFVDLSFSSNSIDKLEEILHKKNCKLIWCDHHTSSMEVLRGNPEYNKIPGIRKEGISGAALTWMYFKSCSFEEIPKFVKYVSDFDCWKFSYSDTMFFKYGLESTEYDALDIIWNQLVRDGSQHTLLNQMIEKGKAIDAYVTREYALYKEKYAYEGKIDGYKCLIVNRSCNSLIFGDSINDYPIVAIWAYDGKKYKYSLYSTHKDVDCSKIAEKFGGGGHKGAAGFVSDKLVFNK